MISALTLQPTVTGDAVARYERLSHGGSLWHDIMPNAADGTLSGDGSWWPNFVTGDSNYVAIGNPAKLDFSSAFTLCAWAYQNPDPPIQGGEYLIGKDGLAAGTRNVGLSTADNNALISGFIFPSGSAGSFAAVQYDADTGVQHFSVLVNEGGGGDLLLYVDGVLRATNAGKGDPISWTPGTPWELGRRQDGSDYLTGSMDTVRFYDRALSADEILRDYHAGKPAHP